MATKTETEKTTTSEQSTEEQVLGIQPVSNEVKNINYESEEIFYKVTTLATGRQKIFRGDVIESFIGDKNDVARKALINGEKGVFTKDGKGNDILKIEVM